jgi:hypothetical protein
MMKAGWMLALILMATLGTQAQDAAKKDTPPKAAVGESQAVLETWNDVARKLNTMAEDFPEGSRVRPKLRLALNSVKLIQVSRAPTDHQLSGGTKCLS